MRLMAGTAFRELRTADSIFKLQAAQTRLDTIEAVIRLVRLDPKFALRDE